MHIERWTARGAHTPGRLSPGYVGYMVPHFSVQRTRHVCVSKWANKETLEIHPLRHWAVILPIPKAPALWSIKSCAIETRANTQRCQCEAPKQVPPNRVPPGHSPHSYCEAMPAHPRLRLPQGDRRGVGHRVCTSRSGPVRHAAATTTHLPPPTDQLTRTTLERAE